MIYNKKNYWYKKNNGLLFLNNPVDVKKYAKGFGSSVYNYTNNLKNIYSKTNLNYRFNIVCKTDISLFGETYIAGTIYNIAKNHSIEEILTSDILREYIRTGVVVAMNASMDINSYDNILLNTQTFKENVFSNKDYTQVLITISCNQSFTSGISMLVPMSCDIDGILSPTGYINIGSVYNHYVATNSINDEVLIKSIKNSDTGAEQYLIEYKNISGISVAKDILFNFVSTYSNENLIKVEQFKDAIITNHSSNKYFVSNVAPVNSFHTTRFTDILSIILANNQLLVTSNLSDSYNFTELMINTDYEKATYHLINGDINLYNYLKSDYDISLFDVKTTDTFYERNYFVSNDIIEDNFSNYLVVDYFVDEFTNTDPLIIDGNVIYDKTLLLIQNQGLYEYLNKDISPVLNDYNEFKCFIRYGKYAGKYFVIDTDNDDISVISKRFVLSDNYIIRNKSEYTLPKDLNLNNIKFNRSIRNVYIDNSDYFANTITDNGYVFKISDDYLRFESGVSSLYLGGVACKKIFGFNTKKYTIIDSALYTINTNDVFNMTKTLVHQFAFNVIDISFYNSMLYLLHENKITVYDISNNTSTTNTTLNGLQFIEKTSSGFYACSNQFIYDLNTNRIVREHSSKIILFKAYADKIQFCDINNEYHVYTKGVDFDNIAYTNNTYNFSIRDKNKQSNFSIVNNKLEIEDKMIYLDGISDYIIVNDQDITKKLDIDFTIKYDSNIVDNTHIFYYGNKKISNILPTNYLVLNIRNTNYSNKVVLSYRCGNESYNLVSNYVFASNTEYDISIVVTKSSSKYLFKLVINNDEFVGDLLYTSDITDAVCYLGKSDISNIYAKTYISTTSGNFVVNGVTASEISDLIKHPQMLEYNNIEDTIIIVDEIVDEKVVFDYDISANTAYGIYDNKECLNVSSNLIIPIILDGFNYASGDSLKVTMKYYTDATVNQKVFINGVLYNVINNSTDSMQELHHTSVFNGYATDFIINATNVYPYTFYIYSIHVEIQRNTDYYKVYSIDNKSYHYDVIHMSPSFRDIYFENKLYYLTSSLYTDIDLSIDMPLSDSYRGILVDGNSVFLYNDINIFDSNESPLYTITNNIDKIDISNNIFYVESGLDKQIIKHATASVYHINHYVPNPIYDFAFGVNGINKDGAYNFRFYSNNTLYRTIDSDILCNDELSKPLFVTYDENLYLILNNKIVIYQMNINKRFNYESSNIILNTTLTDNDYVYLDENDNLIIGKNNTYYISSIADISKADMYFSNITSNYQIIDENNLIIGDNSLVFINGSYKNNVYRNSLKESCFVPYKKSLMHEFEYDDTNTILMVGDYGTILRYDFDIDNFIYCKTNKPVFTRLNSVVGSYDISVVVGDNGTILFSQDNLNFDVFVDDISLNYTDVVLRDDKIYVTTNYGNIRVYHIGYEITFIETIDLLPGSDLIYKFIFNYKNENLYLSENKVIYKDTIINTPDIKYACLVNNTFDTIYILSDNSIYSLIFTDATPTLNLDVTYTKPINSIGYSGNIKFCGDNMMVNNSYDYISLLDSYNLIFTDYNLARKSYIFDKDKSPKKATGIIEKPFNNSYFFNDNDIFDFRDTNVSGELNNYTAYQDFYYINSRTINNPVVGQYEDGFKKYDKTITTTSDYYANHTSISSDYLFNNNELIFKGLDSNDYTIIGTVLSLYMNSANFVNNKYEYVFTVDNMIFEIGDFVRIYGMIYQVKNVSASSKTIQVVGNENLNLTNYTDNIERLSVNMLGNLKTIDTYNNTDLSVINVKVISKDTNRNIVENDRLNLFIKLTDIDVLIEAESVVTLQPNGLFKVSFDLKTTIIDFEFETLSIQEFSDRFRQYELVTEYITYTLSARNELFYPQDDKIIEHKFEALDFNTNIDIIDAINIGTNKYILSSNFIHVYDENNDSIGNYSITGSYKYMVYNAKYNAIYLTGNDSIGVFDLNTDKIIFSEILGSDTCIYHNNFVYVNSFASNLIYRYDYLSKTIINGYNLIAVYNNVEYLYNKTNNSVYTDISTPVFFCVLDSTNIPLGISNNTIFTDVEKIDISSKLKTTLVTPKFDGNFYTSNKTIYTLNISKTIPQTIVDILYTDNLYVLTSSDILCYDKSLNYITSYSLPYSTRKLIDISNEAFLLSDNTRNFVSLILEKVEPANASIEINSLILDETYVTLYKTNDSITVNDYFTDDMILDLNNKDNYVYVKNLNYSSNDMLSLKINFDKHLLHEAFDMDFSTKDKIKVSSNITDYNKYFNLETIVLFNNIPTNIIYDNTVYGMDYTLLKALPYISPNTVISDISYNNFFTQHITNNSQFSIYKNTILVSENISSGLENLANLFINIEDPYRSVQKVYISKIEKIQYIGKNTYYYLIHTNRDLSILKDPAIFIRTRDRLLEISDDLNATDTTMFDISTKYVTNFLEEYDMSRYHKTIREDLNIRLYTSAWVGYDNGKLVLDVYNWSDDVSLNYRPVEILEMGSDKTLKKAVSVTEQDYDISNTWFGVKNSGIYNYILTDKLTVAILEEKYNWVLNSYIKNAIIGLDDNNEIVWYRGEYLEGDFDNGTWLSGIAYNMNFSGNAYAKNIEYIGNLVYIKEDDISKTVFVNCVINGDFNNGYLYESQYMSGNFTNGVMSGNFNGYTFNGTFIGGNFIGNFIGGIFNSSRYKSYFIDGVMTGEFENGTFIKGVLRNSIFGTKSTLYKPAIMEYGYIINSTINCGDKSNLHTIIYNANIESCTMNGGIIKLSNWMNGTMNYGMFDTDNDIVAVNIRQDIVSENSTFVDIVMKNKHYFKHINFENKDVANYITIQGKPKVYNGSINPATISLGYNTDVKQHYIVEIKDEYTVTIELEKEFPYGQTIYSYTSYQPLHISEMNFSGLDNGFIKNNSLYTVSPGNNNYLLETVNDISTNYSVIPQNYIVFNNDIFNLDISNELYKNGVLIQTFNENVTGLLTNNIKIVIIGTKKIYVLDNTGSVLDIIQHSSVSVVPTNYFMYNDIVMFDTNANIVKIDISSSTIVKTSFNTTRVLGNIVGNLAYYRYANNDGFIYNIDADSYTLWDTNVSNKSNITYLNNTKLIFNNNEIFDLDTNLLLSTISDSNVVISDIVTMFDKRYLCNTSDKIIELDESFTETTEFYEIPFGGITDLVSDDKNYIYAITANKIYLLSTKYHASEIDYMLPFQPSKPVTQTLPAVINSNYIGGVKLASRWNNGVFNGGIFRYGYFYSGVFIKGIFRDGIIEKCQNFGGLDKKQ